jgi:nucleotide-binding universal stress UspA family protein
MMSSGHGILVGYDGSLGSEQALSWAAREARSRGTPLTLCHIWSLGFTVPPEQAAGVLDLARRSGEQVIAEGLRHARDVMPPGLVRERLAEGSATAVLCEGGHDADMVVVGSRGRDGLARLLLGSVSSRVAAYAPGRVVVIRGHWRPAGGYVPGPIVVGADGSAASRAAVDFAVEEAALRDAPLLAVCALADAPGSLGESRRQEEFEEAMIGLEKEHPGTTILRHVAIGGARDALLTTSRDAQMLIVGSRGQGGLRGMLLGSVSQVLINHAPCPVGVVHPR